MPAQRSVKSCEPSGSRPVEKRMSRTWVFACDIASVRGRLAAAVRSQPLSVCSFWSVLLNTCPDIVGHRKCIKNIIGELVDPS